MPSSLTPIFPSENLNAQAISFSFFIIEHNELALVLPLLTSIGTTFPSI